MPATDRRVASYACTQERSFRHLVQTVALAVWETDPGGHPLPSSSSWSALTGQSEEAVNHGTLTVVVHPDDKAATEAAWEKSLADSSIHH